MDQEDKGEIDVSGPLLFEKKLLAADKFQWLEQQRQKLAAENAEVLSLEKVMLEKFVEKSETFVSRLEEYLKAFTSQNVDIVVLTDDMVDPEYGEDGNAPENLDPLEKLRNWYPVVQEYVMTQREKVQKLTSEWFDHLNAALDDSTAVTPTVEVKPESRSDPKPKSRSDPKPKSRSDPKLDKKDSFNALFVLLIILVAFLHTLLFYDPEDVTTCTDQPVVCFLKDVFYYVSLAYEKYIQFHNITLEYGQAPSLNNSITEL